MKDHGLSRSSILSHFKAYFRTRQGGRREKKERKKGRKERKKKKKKKKKRLEKSSFAEICSSLQGFSDFKG